MSIQEETKAKKQKVVDAYHHNLNSVRSGAISPSILDPVTVELHGMKNHIEHIASINVRDARTLFIKPWDKKDSFDAIVRAIGMANIGVSVSSEGDSIKLTIPPLSTERRHELVKVCKSYAENARVGVRTCRRDAIEKLRKQEKNKEISEDDLKREIKKIEDLTENFIKQIEELLEKKEHSLLQDI